MSHSRGRLCCFASRRRAARGRRHDAAAQKSLPEVRQISEAARAVQRAVQAVHVPGHRQIHLQQPGPDAVVRDVDRGGAETLGEGRHLRQNRHRFRQRRRVAPEASQVLSARQQVCQQKRQRPGRNGNLIL